MLDASPAYSIFAGLLGGFLFLGIVTLMAERGTPDRAARTSDEALRQGDAIYARPDKRVVSRERSLMLFLPALLSLLVSSFLFGDVSGEQVCARGYIEGVIAASLLGSGALGVFGGIVWMLDAYGEQNSNLRRTANVFSYIASFIVVALLALSGDDVINDAFNNNPPWYALVPVIAYGPSLLILMLVVRVWFMPHEGHRSKAQLTAVYFPAGYVVVAIIAFSILTSYSPAEWLSLNDWKAYLALSLAMFFPAVIVLIYTRALPDIRQ